MGVMSRLIHGRAAELTVGEQVTHVDIGEVTVDAIDGRYVRIRDEHGEHCWVPATEIN